MLWSENPGRIDAGAYIPNGYEVGYDNEEISDLTQLNQFLILSDHNRSSLEFSIDRIEQRERMINGRMRSYHIADKLQASLSWSMLPSRSFRDSPSFSETGIANYSADDRYTVDGGAGGVNLLSWYESHPGPFWVYLAYDKFNKDGVEDYSKLAEYNQVVEMYISDFSYSVVKRGTGNHDFWDISVSLEEV
jgi:hypothetical protein